MLSLPHPHSTHAFGNLLGRSLPAGTILMLDGDLGSGKTTLVQGIGQGLGIADAIVSPTFTLINEYHEGRVPLYHLDLYRLTPEQVADLFIEAYWSGEDFPLGIVAIEWAERLLELPLNYLRIFLTSTSDDGRQAVITSVGNVSMNWQTAIESLS